MADEGVQFAKINPAFSIDEANESTNYLKTSVSKYTKTVISINVEEQRGMYGSENRNDKNNNFDDIGEAPIGERNEDNFVQVIPITSSSLSQTERDNTTVCINDAQRQVVSDVIDSDSPPKGDVTSSRNCTLSKDNSDDWNGVSSEDIKWLSWIESRLKRNAGLDGKICLRKFKDALNVKKSFFADRFFSLLDDDHSGAIQIRKLLDGVRMLANDSPTHKLKFLFDIYDVDGNGRIDRHELKVVLKSCSEESSSSVSEESMDVLTDLVFASVDKDHSGTISFEELEAELEQHPGLLENLCVSVTQWLRPPSRSRTRYLTYAYIRNNLKKLVFLLVYIFMNFILAAYSVYFYWNSNVLYIVSRVCGMNLNFNCVFILVLMLRKTMTYLMMTQLARILPLEKHIFFHKMVGWIIAIAAIFHTLSHVGNAVLLAHDGDLALWEMLFTTRSGLGWVADSAMLTGWVLVLVLCSIVVGSLEAVRRRGYFQVFYMTHMLYIFFWTLLILHAENFWKWFIGPGIIFIIEKLLRSKLLKKARYGNIYIQEANVLPYGVVHLVISRPDNFSYKAGDYVFLQIPVIAKHEWHPFTISSAPEMRGYIWLHVRSAGHWTNKCCSYFENLDPELENGTMKVVHRHQIEAHLEEAHWRKRAKTKVVHIQCFIDGPYGTATREIYDTEHAVLVGAGIGITPMVAVLQSIMYRYKASKRVCPHCHNSIYGDVPNTTLKLKKADFVWVNRDQKAFEWFHSLLEKLEDDQAELELNDDESKSNRILDMHIFMTVAQRKTHIDSIGLQMALDLKHKHGNKDLITGLRTKTQTGRPNWRNLFTKITKDKRGKVKVFYCGAPALGKIIKQECEKLKIGFSKEYF